MKLYVHASSDNSIITNEYLNELFKKIDWDDVDYADRLIDRTIQKELGVDRILDQAKYINMLDDNVKNDLMKLLENPEAIHQRRMKNKKKSTKRPSKSSGTVLTVKYEDYPDGNIKTDEFTGVDRIDALKKMVDSLLLYIDVEEIESDDLDANSIISEIESQNGDGCDYIIKLTDNSTGEVLMDYPIDEYYEE